METLENELNELNQQYNIIKNKIDITKNKIKDIKLKADKENDIIELERVNKYLLENKVYFGDINLKKLYHAKSSYDIDTYYYKLKINNFSRGNFSELYGNIFEDCTNIEDLSITCISEPSNNIEKNLYPYIVTYLQSYLPIKFEKCSNIYDEGYNLKAKNNAPISFTMNDGAFIRVYYLSKYGMFI